MKTVKKMKNSNISRKCVTLRLRIVQLQSKLFIKYYQKEPIHRIVRAKKHLETSRKTKKKRIKTENPLISKESEVIKHQMLCKFYTKRQLMVDSEILSVFSHPFFTTKRAVFRVSLLSPFENTVQMKVMSALSLNRYAVITWHLASRTW